MFHFILTKCGAKKYPILHLEALALVCVIKKFHKFLFGQQFKVFTDHKPLIGIFGREGRNSIFVTRLQRYVMELSIYDFVIEYRPGSKLGNADFCSRFPLDQKIPGNLDQEYIKSLNFSNELPIDLTLVSKETQKDKYLSEIIKFMTFGWPKKITMQDRDFFAQRSKLELVDGIMMVEDKVVIPYSLREGVLTLLHTNHQGMVKMKTLARRSVFWPGLTLDIEEFVKSCDSCAKMEVVKKSEPLGSWIPTTRPFSRLHADFFYLEGNNFLLIVDSHTKWLEVEWMRSGTTARIVNKKFAAVFARFGLPDVVVTDGGPPFNSYEFVEFLEKHGIKVLKSPPYHPASNGQAERMVRVAKEVLKKFLVDNKTKSLDMDDKLNLFLINYRNSSSGEEGSFPSEKMLSYQPKMLLDLINPNKTYKHYLDKDRERENLTPREEASSNVPQDGLNKLVAGDKLFYKNVNKFPRWLEATFVKRMSDNVFQILIGKHKTNAHRQQLKEAYESKRNKTIVHLPSSTSKRKRDSIEDEEDFEGFSSFPRPDDRTERKKIKIHRGRSRSPINTRSRTAHLS